MSVYNKKAEQWLPLWKEDYYQEEIWGPSEVVGRYHFFIFPPLTLAKILRIVNKEYVFEEIHHDGHPHCWLSLSTARLSTAV